MTKARVVWVDRFCSIGGRSRLMAGILIACLMLALTPALGLGAAGGGTGSFGGGYGGGGYGGGGYGGGGGYSPPSYGGGYDYSSPSGGGGFGFGFDGSDYGGGYGAGGDVDISGAGAVAILVIFGVMAIGIAIAFFWSNRSMRRERRAMRSETRRMSRIEEIADERAPQRAVRRDDDSAEVRALRVAQATRAASVASADDVWFDPEALSAAAIDLFMRIQRSWDARDLSALSVEVGADLMDEWQLRLDDFERKGWHNRVEVQGQPAVELVGLTNHADDSDDRVVVRISARVDDYVVTDSGRVMLSDGCSSKTTELREYWTMRWSENDQRWFLESIEQDREGAHNLYAELLANPEDDQALADEARIEVAEASSTDNDSWGELVDIDLTSDARAQAMELSLLDGRFDPDVIILSARRALSAWQQAIDGDDADLERLASDSVREELLYPGGSGSRERRVVRGAREITATIGSLMTEAAPARVRVGIRMSGIHYFQNRDTTTLTKGSKSAPQPISAVLTLSLGDDPENPWTLDEALVGTPE